MLATALGFAVPATFRCSLLVAFLGTFNPSGGDVSVFLPTEQALLGGAATARPNASALFARYNLGGRARRRARRARGGLPSSSRPARVVRAL